MVYTNTNVVYKCQFFLANTGIAAKRHTPDWKGIDDFQGTWVHPSFWPKEEPDLRGKRIAVIGTGATGVQLTQDLAPLASEFALFQRTPNLALPMKQVDLTEPGTDPVARSEYDTFFKGRKDSFGGFDYNFMGKSTFQDSAEDRLKVYEELWNHGDFHFWLATYWDLLFDDSANTEAYNFWYACRSPLFVVIYRKLTQNIAGARKSGLVCPRRHCERSLRLPPNRTPLAASEYRSRTGTMKCSPSPMFISWT